MVSTIKNGRGEKLEKEEFYISYIILIDKERSQSYLRFMGTEIRHRKAERISNGRSNIAQKHIVFKTSLKTDCITWVFDLQQILTNDLFISRLSSYSILHYRFFLLHN